MDGTLIIAFSENGGTEMIPVSRAGRLLTFETIKAGRAAAGALGVAAPTTPARVRELCERHGLALPDLRKLELLGGAEC